MKLIRFGSAGAERPGLQLADGRRIDAAGFGSDYDEAFFRGDGLARLAQWSAANSAKAPTVSADERLGPPCCRPSKLICIGLNYRGHAAETGAAVPKEPILFMKATSAIVGPNDDVVIPRGSEKTDWEVELGVVIGRKASYVDEGSALDHVAGYVLHNDYSERAFQLERGTQWSKGKSCDTFAPLGPFIATPDEVDAGNAELWLDLNGEKKQRGNTNDFVFGVATVVSYISQFMSLLPGDIISTGTPAGVGMGEKPPRYLKDGDVITLGVTGLGEQRQQARAYR
ncbi:MAG: fumarylacetoacetate hydrolase family protein [Gemmatimonadota bacterium]|nr:fumarylacetoacetate hydrolase family protein [Gemmatimonadota bacterium]